MVNIKYEDILRAINCTDTMAKAAEKAGMKFSTFKRKAIKFGLYKANQGRIGISREEYEMDSIRIPLDKILNGDFPFYSRSHLKKRILKNGIKENKCEICGLVEWNGKDIKCELDHIDGDSKNHRLENLRMLCPNCHSQTDTHSCKKERSRKYTKYEFIEAVESSKNFSELKIKLGISVSQPNNYLRDLMSKYKIKFIDK